MKSFFCLRSALVATLPAAKADDSGVLWEVIPGSQSNSLKSLFEQ